jgi:Mrp family chromosome partitioning ATPase
MICKKQILKCTVKSVLKMASLANPPKAGMDVPANANAGCVGSASARAGAAAGCEGCPNQAACASGAGRKVDPALAEVAERMRSVKHTLLVLSGKGGVGKSTFSAQLAFALAARKGARVGLLDVDICGPSVPLMLGLVGHEVKQSGSGWSPVYVTQQTKKKRGGNGNSNGSGSGSGSGSDSDSDSDDENELGVMSIGFMLPSRDDAVIWRGPRKNALIKQFLTDVDWGELDYLVIDTPPGTSDEHISIAQYLRGSLDPAKDGAIVITTPQEAAMADVRKELNFCKKVGMRVLGVVENMSGLVVPMSSAAKTVSEGGLRIMDSATGADRTEEMVRKLRAACPELLDACSLKIDVFKSTASTEHNPETMAKAFGVPFLGKMPLDREMCAACEGGRPLQGGALASKSLRAIVNAVVGSVTSDESK